MNIDHLIQWASLSHDVCRQHFRIVFFFWKRECVLRWRWRHYQPINSIRIPRIRGRERQNRSDRKNLRYCEIIIVKVSICLFVCLYVCIHLICPRMMIQAIRKHFNGIFISTQTWPLYCLIFVLTSSYLFVSRYYVGLYNCWRSFWIFLPKYCTGKVTNGN